LNSQKSSRNYRSDYLLTQPFAQRTGNDVILELCAAKINVING